MSRSQGGHPQGTQHMDSSRLSQVAYLTGLAEIDEQGEDDAGDPDAKGSAESRRRACRMTPGRRVDDEAVER